MKFLVHYGYYECEGIKIFNSEKQVKKFLTTEQNDASNKANFGFEVYKVKSIEKIKIDLNKTKNN